jgi:hypothetical protein
MNAFFGKTIGLNVVGLTGLLLSTEITLARPALAQRITPDVPMGQVTSVSQLSDVQPTDWAFQALQSLVERYGCIAGYPDRTYRGNRAMTRYEFAAGLNACMDRVNELIAAATEDLATKEDLATLQKLQEEFAAELATLRGRVDALEVRTATLEQQQFSTTTKLSGEVVTALSGVAAGDTINGVPVDRNTIFSDRVRLELSTSFTGRDLLFTRLATGNTPPLLQGAPLEGGLSFEQDEGNDLGLEVLYYQFPIGERTEITVGPAGIASDDFAPTLNVLDGDGGSGSISLFGTRNPIFTSSMPGGGGIGIRHKFSDLVELSAGYLATEAADPTAGSGLFNGGYGALAQLTFTPTERLGIAFTYVNGYNVDAAVGTNRANITSFIQEEFGFDGPPIISNSYALTASWQVSDNFVLGGWGTYSNSQILGGEFAGVTQDIWSWAVTLGFPDIFKDGNLGGIVVGQLPTATGSNNSLFRDRNTSLHVEGFFQAKLTDQISITPGIIWLPSPNADNRNGDVVIGTIRTTFEF